MKELLLVKVRSIVNSKHTKFSCPSIEAVERTVNPFLEEDYVAGEGFSLHDELTMGLAIDSEVEEIFQTAPLEAWSPGRCALCLVPLLLCLVPLLLCAEYKHLLLCSQGCGEPGRCGACLGGWRTVPRQRAAAAIPDTTKRSA